jgi:pimeloyl-ACP methyl ester carboxylesterase
MVSAELTADTETRSKGRRLSRNGGLIATAVLSVLVAIPLLATPALAAPDTTAADVQAAAAKPARNDSLNEPIYFVHGFDKSTNPHANCAADWGPAINKYKASGATGPMITVGYYNSDTNCNVTIGRGGRKTPIKDFGKQLAWDIYNRYSKHGRSVDAVGHSMGGLIIRAALTGTQRKESGFPPYLYVEDVVTLGTPHTGAKPLGIKACLKWHSDQQQCKDFTAGSGFLRWLAQNPQSAQGTDWTLIGSDDDGIVDEKSATGMDAGHKVIFGQGLGHSDLMKTVNGAYKIRYWNYYDKAWKTINSGAASPIVTAKNANYFWWKW